MNVTKKGAILLSSLALVAGVAGTVALQTHAATDAGSAVSSATGSSTRQFTPPAASGSVTAISGNTITLTDKRSGTVYTVDASSAAIEKMPTEAADSSTGTARPTPTTISVSGILVGDNVMVEGAVNGTGITATKIMDGMMGGRGGHMEQPGITGTVASVSGSTIALTGTDGKTYTVDAGSATLKKVSTISVSDVQAGDALMVNGTTSGTTITAKNIMDGTFPQKPDGSNSSGAQ